jgi:hypothetical protein
MIKNKLFIFILSFVLNYFIVWVVNLNIQILDIFTIQIFLFTLSLLGDLLHQKFSNKKDITPSHFLSINFSRIFLCVLFLVPTILRYSKPDNIYIYNFFIVYFIYLFSDIIFKQRNTNKINI